MKTEIMLYMVGYCLYKPQTWYKELKTDYPIKARGASVIGSLT